MGTNAVRNTLIAAGRANGRLCMALFIACFLSLVAVQPTWAADFQVTTEKDGVDADLNNPECISNVVPGGACTLRAAIQQANFTPNQPDKIFLPEGTFILTIKNPLDISEEEAATGDLDITSNIVIEGAGPTKTVIEAASNLHDRVFEMIDDQAVVALNKLTVRNGNTTDLVSAISQDGGGIRNGGGTLEASDLAVISNTSPENGGGIMTIGTTSTTIERCTISGNKADGNNSQGGGISLGQNHSLTLINCTISDNAANSRGGGINLSNNSKVTILLNTTIANNRLLASLDDGGGIYIGNSTDVSFLSTIIANNFAQGNVANDCKGQLNVLDFSLVEVPLAGNGCRVSGAGQNNSSLFGSADPKLGSLADNGGGLQTHALLEGSIAIDAGNPATPGSSEFACAAVDERGHVRPARSFCDMGAFELGPVLYMPLLNNSQQ